MRAKRSSTNISTALAAVTRPFRLLRCGQLPRSKRSHSNVLGTATLVLLTLLAFSLTPPSPSYAATLTVCASGCYTTIAAAIAAANPLGGDTISIQDASHNEANITVDRDLTIQGQGATNTAVDGTGISGSVFTISAGVTATIQDVTVRNGSAFLGGGIYNNGTVTISNGTLSGNSAGYGGGGKAENGDGLERLQWRQYEQCGDDAERPGAGAQHVGAVDMADVARERGEGETDASGATGERHRQQQVQHDKVEQLARLPDHRERVERQQTGRPHRAWRRGCGCEC